MIDFYCVLNNFDLNFDSIQQMLVELKLAEFETHFRGMVSHLFKNEPLLEEEQIMLE